MRLAVQLVDAVSGAHLWAETYDRSFSPEAVFELQDDLVPQIVSTVADMHGVLPRSMSDTVRKKASDQLTPYEALLHSFGYNERFTPEALAEARTCLERAVQQDPGNGDCWAMLSLMYSNEFGHWDIRDPASFEKALRAARRRSWRRRCIPCPTMRWPRRFSSGVNSLPLGRRRRGVSLNPPGCCDARHGIADCCSASWPLDSGFGQEG